MTEQRTHGPLPIPPFGAHQRRRDQLLRELGWRLRRQREKQGLRRSDVARALGYRNLSRACQRIAQWERGRPETVLDREAYMAALGLEGHDELRMLTRDGGVEQRIERLGRSVVNADRDLIRRNAPRFVRQADAICREPRLAGVRSPATWVGGRALSLGALAHAWTTGGLTARDDQDAPVRLFEGSGSLFSGRGRCSGVGASGRIRTVSHSFTRFLPHSLPEWKLSPWSLADAVAALGGSAPCTHVHLLDHDALPSKQPVATYDPTDRTLTWSGGPRQELADDGSADLSAHPVSGGVSVGGRAPRPLTVGSLQLGGLPKIQHACGRFLRHGRVETASGWFPIALDGPSPPLGILPLLEGWLSGLMDSG